MTEDEKIEIAKTKAISMARAKLERGVFKDLNKYNILSNPYLQCSQKKSHVIWHNAFYAECKVLGRNIQ